MRRKILYLCSAVFIFAAPLYIFYWHYENISDSLMADNHFDWQRANAFKHAYAAAQIFTLLANITTKENATDAVLFLGYTNERFEQIIDRFTADNTSEIVKDLTNNQAGITAAIWHAHHPNKTETIHDLLIILAQHNILIVENNPDIVSPEAEQLTRQAAVNAAIAKFSELQPTIITHIETALDHHIP